MADASPPPLPRLRRTAFHRRGDDFFEALHDAIEEALGEGPIREERWGKLTEAQRGFHAWFPFYTNVENGGLSQFFYNRGGRAVPALAALLRLAGKEAAALKLERAAEIYDDNREAFETDDPFGEGGLFAEAADSEMGRLDAPVARGAGAAMKPLEKWAREHIAEIAAGDDGEPIDPKFTGVVEVRDADGRLVERAEVRRGLLDGLYQTFEPDGTPATTLGFAAGEPSGAYWPNGQARERTTKSKGLETCEWFYPSGALQKRHVSDKTGYPIEPVRVWHENGQLAEENHKDIQAEGKRPWLRFFEDGSPRLEAEFRGRHELPIIHNAWDDRRVQVVKDGEGTYFDDGLDYGASHRLAQDFEQTCSAELRGGVRHGVALTWDLGVLTRRALWDDGKLHGEMLRYHRNGRVVRRYVYSHGKEIASETFPAFTAPRPAVALDVESDAPRYDRWGLAPLDEYPSLANADEVRESLPIPDHLFGILEAGPDGEDGPDLGDYRDDRFYWVEIDERGLVASLAPPGGRPNPGDDLAALLARMRFLPGRRGDRAVPSRAVVDVRYEFVEGDAG